MSDRNKTKEVLLNEFIGTAVALGTAAALGGLVYSGQKKGTGFRYRFGERLKALPSYISREIQKDTLSKINKRHADYHAQIASKYDLAPQQYATILGQHHETNSRFSDRERLISEIKPYISKALNDGVPSLRKAGLNPDTEPFTKYYTGASHIPEFHGKSVTEVANMHKQHYVDPRTGNKVLDSHGNPYTIGDAMQPTRLEQLDYINPAAADFRKKVQSSIFAPQTQIADKLRQNIQNTSSQPNPKIIADLNKQKQDLKLDRDALPLATEPGISNAERVKRALHKGFRTTVDFARTAF